MPLDSIIIVSLALAFIVGIPVVLLFYFLRSEADKTAEEEAFLKEFRKDPERAVDRAPWKYESRADYDARMATLDAYNAREADKELRKGPGEHHREKGEPPRTRQHPEQTHHQLSASKPREPACHPHSETPFNPAPAVAVENFLTRAVVSLSCLRNMGE